MTKADIVNEIAKNTGIDKVTVLTTVATHKMTWKLVSDLKGWKCAGSRAYAVNSIPSTVLIDKNGNIVGKNLSIPEMEKLMLEKGTKK